MRSVSLSGYTIDPLKWDSDKQLVKSNTTHKIGGKIVYAREINNAIRSFLVCIEEVFAKYDLHSKIPTTTDLKKLVNEKLGRTKEVEVIQEDENKTLKDIFLNFYDFAHKKEIGVKMHNINMNKCGIN